jgi:hypothetical protein
MLKIEGKAPTLLRIVIFSFVLLQCTTARRENIALPLIAYPGPYPDSTALKFLPGIVSADSLDFNSAFSPDGQSFYFARSWHGKWRILVSRFSEGHWSDPEIASFSEKEYSQADATFGPDGSLYYISNRPRSSSDTIPDYDIWVVRQQNDGSWSAPENVAGVNSDSTEYYVSLAGNGNLYFASSRPGGLGDHDIYVSRLVNDQYTAPENLGASINGPQMEHDPVVSRDEQYLFFTSVDRRDSFGSGDIYFSKRSSNNQWSTAINVGSKINTPTYEYCSYITADEKYFFFSSNFDVKWIQLSALIPDK